MLENLGNRFQDIMKKVRGHGKLSESNIKEALREVRMSLLEADVNYKVVKDFVAKIQEKAIGAEVLTGINPGQQFIKIVNDELVELLGGTNSRLTKSAKNPVHPYTKALLSAIPIPSIKHKMSRERLKGEITSPVNPGVGCRFRKRCSMAIPECGNSTPVLREISPGHFYACHLIGKEEKKIEE